MNNRESLPAARSIVARVCEILRVGGFSGHAGCEHAADESLIDCEGSHNIDPSIVPDGGVVTCDRCGQSVRVIRMQRRGDRLRVKDPARHGMGRKKE